MSLAMQTGRGGPICTSICKAGGALGLPPPQEGGAANEALSVPVQPVPSSPLSQFNQLADLHLTRWGPPGGWLQ